jgi:probable HAF family extracellular repeat protein
VPQDINNAGVVVGEYKDTGGTTHGFVFDGTTWATVDYPGASLTSVHGINDEGLIVGHYDDFTGTKL